MCSSTHCSEPAKAVLAKAILAKAVLDCLVVPFWRSWFTGFQWEKIWNSKVSKIVSH